MDGSLPVVEADLELMAGAAEIVGGADMPPSSENVLDVPFPNSVTRGLLLVAVGEVLLATSELGFPLLGCRDDSGYRAVVDALRPPDADSDLVLRFGGSIVLEMEEGVTSDEIGEEPTVGRLDEVPSDRDDGSLRMEEAGEGMPTE